jgi:hypothetical protein
VNGGRLNNAFDVATPSAAGVIVMDLSALDIGSGGSLRFHGPKDQLRAGPGEAPQWLRSGEPLGPAPSDAGVFLRNLQYDASKLGSYLAFSDLAVPVLIENCRICAAEGFARVSLMRVKAPVTIRNNPRLDQGLALSDLPGPALIQNNTIAGDLSLLETQVRSPAFRRRAANRVNAELSERPPSRPRRLFKQAQAAGMQLGEGDRDRLGRRPRRLAEDFPARSAPTKR